MKDKFDARFWLADRVDYWFVRRVVQDHVARIATEQGRNASASPVTSAAAPAELARELEATK
jgi:hypothetical protein